MKVFVLLYNNMDDSVLSTSIFNVFSTKKLAEEYIKAQWPYLKPYDAENVDYEDCVDYINGGETWIDYEYADLWRSYTIQEWDVVRD